MRFILLTFLLIAQMHCSDFNSNSNNLIKEKVIKTFEILNRDNELLITKDEIEYVINNPKEFKHLFEKYLTNERDWSNENNLPVDDFFYLVGATRDTSYSIYLQNLVKHNIFSNYYCVYDCGLVFAFASTATNKALHVIEEINLNKGFIFGIKDFYKKLKNTKNTNIEERKILLKKSIIFADKEKQLMFERIQNLSIRELFEIAENINKAYDERLMAINSISFLNQSPKYLPNILNILINVSDFEEYEIRHSCNEAILQIFIRNN